MIALLCGLAGTAHADDLVYTPNNPTFGGNPLGTAIGREVIAMLRTGVYQERARVLGARLAAGLDDLVGYGVDRVRAFVKIQDGCSFSCSFCVVPSVRGDSRSRSADAVLAEVRRRVAQGHREIVFTGINLGCYRDRAAGYDLPRLVREAGAVAGLVAFARIYLGAHAPLDVAGGLGLGIAIGGIANVVVGVPDGPPDETRSTDHVAAITPGG